MRNILFITCFSFLLSCKTQPNSGHSPDGDLTRVFKLRLNPPPGSKYYYSISNRTELKLELEDKKVDNLSKSDIGVVYAIARDSVGNLDLHVSYDKIHMYSKNGDAESDMDAVDAANSTDPVEKMLGIVRAADIRAVMSPAGEVKQMTGYKEILDKFLAAYPGTDPNDRIKMQGLWKQKIGEGVIKKNIEQLFRLFPDSTVHIGDKWKLSTTQNDGIPIHVTGSFAIKDISGGIALIQSEGEIVSDSSMTQIMGYQVTINLKGRQDGEYEMETATGMLQTAAIKMHVEGTIQLLAREVPLSLETTIKISGRKME